MSVCLFARNSRRTCGQVIKTVVCKSTNIDAIDSFTKELVQRKALKWEIYKKNLAESQSGELKEPSYMFTNLTKTAHQILAEFKKLRDLELCVDLRNLTPNHIDQLVASALDENNQNILNDLLQQCITHRKIPSEQVIRQICVFLSRNGNLNLLEKFIQFCDQMNPKLYRCNDGFKLYYGWCVWNTGNCDVGLNELRAAYARSNPILRKTVRNILEAVVRETISKKSEAILVKITEFAQDLLVEYDDPIILVYLWKISFLSVWFSDQQRANELFEKYSTLRHEIGERTGMLCYSALQNHNLDAVNRLMEIYLKYQMKTECKICFGLLFEYQYWRRNLRACSEVMRTSIDLNIPLPEIYNKKLMNLVLGYPADSAALLKNKVKGVPSSRFELKF